MDGTTVDVHVPNRPKPSAVKNVTTGTRSIPNEGSRPKNSATTSGVHEYTADLAAIHSASAVTSSWTSTGVASRSEEHTSELQSRENLVCRLLLEKKKNRMIRSDVRKRQP